MARINLAVSTITHSGLVNALAAANADGYYMTNDGDKRTFLEVANGGGSPITLTIQSTATRDGLAVADKTVEIAAGQRVNVGPFKPSLYNRPDDTIYIDFTAVTSVTIAAFKLAG